MALQIDDDGNIYDDGVDDGNSSDIPVTAVIPDFAGGESQEPVIPDFAGGESQDHDFTKEEADTLWKAGVWDQVKGLGKDVLNLLKTNGKFDPLKLAVLGGGAAAAARSNSTRPTGYQGTVPKLTATRNMLTAPPVGRRPGSGGIDYGGGVTYRDQAGNLVSSNERTLEELRQAAINNPFNRGATYEGQRGLGQSDLVSLLQMINSQAGGASQPATAAPAPAIAPPLPAPQPVAGPSVEFTTGLGSSAPVSPANQVPLNSMNLPLAGPKQEDIDAAFARQNAEFEARKARRAATRADMAARGEDARVAVTSPANFTLSGGVWNPGNAGFAKGGLARDGFVLPADVVSHYGNGSSEAGLKLLSERLGATPIKGEGDGMSDSIPTKIDGVQEARVANDEAYVSPEMVAKLGNGNPEKGAKKLYAMMDKVREARTGTTKQGKQIDPNKFMPGGSVQNYQVGGTTTATRTMPTGATGAESSLSNWAGDYVTNMMGQGAALANAPYQAYTGPLTAGASGLQQQAFQQAGQLRTPGSIGQAAGTAGGIANLAANMRYTPQTTSFLGTPNVSGLDMAPSFGGISAGPAESPERFATDGGMTGGVMSPPKPDYSGMPEPSGGLMARGVQQYESPERFAVDGGMTGGVMRPPKPDYSTMPVPEGGLMARGAQQTGSIAQQYMNPYLESALRPQMAEMQRAADIARMADAARLTQAGAFGGSRQAIMESEGRRNLLGKQSDVLAQGYSTAYDKAMQQFNADQARRAQEAQFGATFGLQGLQTGIQGAQTQGQLGGLESQQQLAGLRSLLDAGAVERGIESEGIAADKAQFEEARMNPYKMVQFQQSLLSGMPLASQSYTMPQQSNLQQFAGGATSIQQLLDILSGKAAAVNK